MGRAARRWIGAGCVTAAAAGAVLAGTTLLGGDAGAAVPTAAVTRGEFRRTHVEAGKLRAARDEKVVSPRVRGDLKIVHLWPDGEQVEAGDLILQFDRAWHAQEIKDKVSRLKQARADLVKFEAEQKRRRAELTMQVAQKEASLELARISLDKAKYGSAIEREEARIGVGQAERAIKDARANLEAQEIVERVERSNREIHIGHRQQSYDRAVSDYERLSVRATRPGLVVHEVIRKRGAGRREKVKEGDVVWSGMSLVALPELDSMQVVSQVGEMDVHSVAAGLPALIRLEALPGPVFHGVVREVAPMAAEKEGAPNVQVFEMVVDITEQDGRLLPGMSASVEVVLETRPGVLTLPIGAVHAREERTIAWRRGSSGFEPVDVSVGEANGLRVVIMEGLEEGDVVALRDPGLM